MTKRTSIRVSGPPARCSDCGTSFRPSIVIGSKVNRLSGLKCSGCQRKDKAAKRLKRFERNEK